MGDVHDVGVEIDYQREAIPKKNPRISESIDPGGYPWDGYGRLMLRTTREEKCIHHSPIDCRLRIAKLGREESEDKGVPPRSPKKKEWSLLDSR